MSVFLTQKFVGNAHKKNIDVSTHRYKVVKLRIGNKIKSKKKLN